MMNKKKTILNGIFLAVVLGLTLYGVFHGQDLGALASYMRQADLRYWCIGIFCVVLFIGSESVIIHYMMRNLGQKLKLTRCFLYSFVGFFFSCITPSATGGQPAQIYYMRKDKVRIPTATLVLMIVTIAYKMVLVLLGIGVLLVRPVKIMQYLNPVLGWMYLGIGLNVVCVGAMLLLVFHPSFARRLVELGVGMLGRMHIVKNPRHWMERTERAMNQYHDVASYFKENKRVVVHVFLITALQRFFLFFVTYLTCRSFKIDGADGETIVLLQGMISVAVDMLPLPGGMGISESLFIKIFKPICQAATLPAMIVSRGLAYYTQLILSAIMTVVAHLVITKGEREDEML